MSDAQNTGGGRGLRVLLVVGAAVIVVLLIAVAALVTFVVTRGGGDPDPTPSPTSGWVREDLEVAVGEGGSSKAPDGTPIGYEGTCTGAVQAATNYSIGLNGSRATGGEVSREDYTALLEYGTRGEYTSTKSDAVDAYFEVAEADPSLITEERPDWGGFSVVACEPEQSAEIWIVSAGGNDSAGYLYGQVGWQLEWIDGDWRVTGTTESSAPVGLPEEPVTAPDPKVVEGLALHSNWEAYREDS